VDDVSCLPPSSIRPVHEPKDPDLLELITLSMREGGWLGRPLLVVQEAAGYQALTGSHRLAAAKAAGLGTVPAIVLQGAVAAKVRASRYFPLYPPGLVQDLFEADEGWLGRFILMDQLVGDLKEPWSDEALEFFRELGHQDMIEVMSVRKWPCQE
jgi:hypothetical protein